MKNAVKNSNSPTTKTTTPKIDHIYLIKRKFNLTETHQTSSDTLIADIATKAAHSLLYHTDSLDAAKLQLELIKIATKVKAGLTIQEATASVLELADQPIIDTYLATNRNMINELVETIRPVLIDGKPPAAIPPTCAGCSIPIYGVDLVYGNSEWYHKCGRSLGGVIAESRPSGIDNRMNRRKRGPKPEDPESGVGVPADPTAIPHKRGDKYDPGSTNKGRQQFRGSRKKNEDYYKSNNPSAVAAAKRSGLKGAKKTAEKRKAKGGSDYTESIRFINDSRKRPLDETITAAGKLVDPFSTYTLAVALATNDADHWAKPIAESIKTVIESCEHEGPPRYAKVGDEQNISTAYRLAQADARRMGSVLPAVWIERHQDDRSMIVEFKAVSDVKFNLRYSKSLDGGLVRPLQTQT